MDENLRFLMNAMNDHRKEIKDDLARVERNLSAKIDVLWAFRLKILGASMFVAGCVSALFEIVRK